MEILLDKNKKFFKANLHTHSVFLMDVVMSKH